MAGGVHSPDQPINWAEKYIERLSRDMEYIRGMEGRITGQINELNGRMNAMQTDLQGRIDRLDDKIGGNEKHIRVMALTTLAGMIATLLAVGGLIYAVISR